MQKTVRFRYLSVRKFDFSLVDIFDHTEYLEKMRLDPVSALHVKVRSCLLLASSRRGGNGCLRTRRQGGQQDRTQHFHLKQDNVFDFGDVHELDVESGLKITAAYDYSRVVGIEQLLA